MFISQCVMTVTLLLVYAMFVHAQTTMGIGATDNTTDSNMTTNGSMSTTTDSITTVQPVTVTPEVTTRFTGQTDEAFPFNSEVAFCTCDLTSGQCDVNCCCDVDCSVSDRQMFTACDEVSLSEATESPACVDPSQLFRHNSEYEVEGSPGCFARSTYAYQNYLLSPSPITYEEEFTNYVRRYGSYSYSSQITAASSPTVATPTNDTNYKTGDLIYTLTAGDVQGVLMTPGLQTTSGQCSDRNPAKFLEDSSVTCRRDIKTVIDAECVGNKYLTSSGYLNTGVRLISSPNLASDTSIPSDALIGVSAASLRQVVDSNLINGSCVNVVTMVTYNIYHTAGIIKQVQLDFNLDDFSNTTMEIYQTYSVRYQEWNTSNAEVFSRSGNPGYVIGEPVISGWLNGDSISLNTDTEDYLTVLSSAVDGTCDRTSRIRVKFGENTATGCIIKSPSSCFIHTPLARSHLLDDSLNTTAYIASFGNSSIDKPGDWIPILRDTLPDSTQCSGLHMTLEILYTKLGALNIPQHRIVGAKLKFEAVEITSASGYALSSTQFSVGSSVSFVDVTVIPPQVTTNIDSRYSLRSPTDFFYPFVWATSGGCHTTIHSYGGGSFLFFLFVSLTSHLYA